MAKKQLQLLTTVLLPIAVFLTGCKDNKVAPQTNSTLTAYEMTMTASDTTAVKALIDQFFGYMESGDVVSAAGMLYTFNREDPLKEPELLNNEQLKEEIDLLSSLPIVGHRVEYIKFNETYLNEAKVSAIIEKAHDGNPEIATVFFFRPYDCVGTWQLCIMDTHKGDNRLIDNSQTDSLQNQFKK